MPLGGNERSSQASREQRRTYRARPADMFSPRTFKTPFTNTDNFPDNRAQNQRRKRTPTTPRRFTSPQLNLNEGAGDKQRRLERYDKPINELNQFSHERAGPPLSRAEQLLKSHPDIRVMRSEYTFGRVELTQRVNNRWREIVVDVEHEEGSQRHYPSVIISTYETPRNVDWDSSEQIRRNGLTTLLKLHVGEDEQVTPEVGYKERQPYPHDFTREQIRDFETHSQPIPAQEIVTTARIGLELLKAYREASIEQQTKIFGDNINNQNWDNSNWAVQFYDGQPGRNMEEYIAEAVPSWLSSALRRKGINYVGTKAIYALNVLNKVTDAMLPSEMPPAPKNRREPARKRTPGQ
jgi:hypothetical protein